MTDQAWEALSNQAVTGCGIVYFLALLAHAAQWASLRRLPADEEPREQVVVFGRFGLLLTVAAGAVHLVGLVARGLAADPNRVPWGNMYEFTLSGTFVVTLSYLLLYRRHRLSWMAPWVVGFVFVTLMAAQIWLFEEVAPLTEALNSPWLVIHVVAAILATGIFSLGGIVSVLYLVKSRVESRNERTSVGTGAGGRTPVQAAEGGVLATEAPSESPAARTGILARVPSLDALDRLSYRLHAFAFPIWTFAVLIAGPIWAHYAWSRYWGWDEKEVWAFITWVVYAAYLHARATAGWRGGKAAGVALIGLATLWFNFIGINFFFGGGSQHSYAAPAAVVETVSASPGPAGASAAG